MSALRESPKCLQSSLIPELHEINVFLLNLRGSFTASCGLCPTGSPWRLNPASHLLVSGENPWASLKASETRRDKERSKERDKRDRKKEKNRGAVQPFGESALVIKWLFFSQVPGPSTQAPEDLPHAKDSGCLDKAYEVLQTLANPCIRY